MGERRKQLTEKSVKPITRCRETRANICMCVHVCLCDYMCACMRVCLCLFVCLSCCSTDGAVLEQTVLKQAWRCAAVSAKRTGQVRA
jgi:hypothetical protein